ncbi:transcriptional regulator of RNA polII, SAGA, subunit-domain-containing protein [Russula brevipes]|nr:transcriptional regulator of RNA polII, SAGA, subunit-domain-containing protein [Russula brevipes]
MSLESTTTIKAKLAAGLGSNAPRYWSLLQSFLAATVSRTEFDEQIRECVGTPSLVQLHNALVISIFDPSTHLVAALTPPPDVPKGPPRKRRRLLPYQGPDPDEPLTLRSSRLKRWAVGIGRRERDRIRNLKPVAYPRNENRGRTWMKLPMNASACNSTVIIYTGLHLQHVTDRLNLICAQHDLGLPSKSVASLMSLAFEAKLKTLIMQALAMTTSSHAISSIQPSAPHSSGHRLSASAFDAMFTASPSVLPNRSAAATRLALGENESREDQILGNEDREPATHGGRYLPCFGSEVL